MDSITSKETAERTSTQNDTESTNNTDVDDATATTESVEGDASDNSSAVAVAAAAAEDKRSVKEDEEKTVDETTRQSDGDGETTISVTATGESMPEQEAQLGKDDNATATDSKQSEDVEESFDEDEPQPPRKEDPKRSDDEDEANSPVQESDKCDDAAAADVENDSLVRDVDNSDDDKSPAEITSLETDESTMSMRSASPCPDKLEPSANEEVKPIDDDVDDEDDDDKMDPEEEEEAIETNHLPDVESSSTSESNAESFAMDKSLADDDKELECVVPSINEETDMDGENDSSPNQDPVFVHVNTEKSDCDTKSIVAADVDEQNGDDSDDICIMSDVDPIGICLDGDKDDMMEYDDANNKDADDKEMEDLDTGKGADEELCIIPDTERVISQEEKDAANALRGVTERESNSAKDGGAAETRNVSEDSETIDRETSAQTVEGEKEKESVVEYVIVEADEGVRTCGQCYLVRTAKYQTSHGDKCTFICDDNCLKSFKKDNPNCVMNCDGATENSEVRIKCLTSGMLSDNMVSKVSFVRKCQECSTEVSPEDNSLSWETMDFCNEDCLSKYQLYIGSNCATCNAPVRTNCLGKYCVRFGYDIRQFCSSTCLEDFKKGLKVCVFCQKDISGSSEGFLAPVGDKGQFKDFCAHQCMEKYEVMSNPQLQTLQMGSCSVCTQQKTIVIEFEHNNKLNKFCSEPCFVAFKFVNNITPALCDMCKKYHDNKLLEQYTMYYDGGQHSFCGKSCQNIYITAHRNIVSCSWCKVKKYNFDMIKKSCNSGQVLMMCSVNCLSLFQVSINAVSSKKITCDHCRKNSQAMYHLTMSDATIRNFCSYHCVMSFQNQFSKMPIRLGDEETTDKPVPTGAPKRNATVKQTSSSASALTTNSDTTNTNLVITNVQSLASSNGPVTRSNRVSKSTASQPAKPHPILTQVIIRNAPVPVMINKFTMVKPIHHSKGVNVKVQTVDKETQTDEIKEKTALIPIPVPIYVPCPVAMWSTPFPIPVPFPIPIPVPIFIPTTRNSANGIMKEIKKIQVKIPTDPFEAELLMMAEIVAGEKKVENTDSESDEEDNGAGSAADGSFSPEAVDTSNAFGDDMLQMALKMATELDEPAVDLEGALTASTITATQGADTTVGTEETTDDPQPIHSHHMMERQSIRGRKRSVRQTRQPPSKRSRRMSQHDLPMLQPRPPAPAPEPIEKPDANMCLKYTFGVNAWKQWVTTKNAELEKSPRRVKLFKNEILQLNSDELNYSLCLFVKEVRKPNGTEYAPDTIYYLCLGIQQYLFESGRIDNIFTDPYYEKFTECLDEVARKFSVLYNDSHYIVTRVEEEHLWESKQLGAHSPHVLLSTLMFFNTKHFNLTTVEEHMQLSFSHIMKHWKRNPNQPGAAKVAGSRNVLLRFYPPQTTLETNTRKKKVYEQQENEENPLRCPVKLYEFYLSKCPESVKTRNDVFYLLPERSCVPDSPVWYSTMALGKEALEKMLHRVKMVKEINVALLTS